MFCLQIPYPRLVVTNQVLWKSVEPEQMRGTTRDAGTGWDTERWLIRAQRRLGGVNVKEYLRI